MKARQADGGLVWHRLTSKAEDTVTAIASAAMTRVAPGRSLAFLWDIPHRWGGQPPYEAWLSAAVLGPPTSRDEHGNATFLLFTRLAVRLYQADADHPSRTICVLVFRKAGDPPYSRRTSTTRPPPGDRLPSTSPVFTRDYANDVWHLRDTSRSIPAIIERLSALMCWSDEPVFEVRGNRSVRRFSRRSDRSLDLVPVPTKLPYDWLPYDPTRLF